ncbi:MAG: chemotaxis protein CheX [Geothrix sp.]|nr:chemotaxis protein CheX [Geothrix sp.]
MPTPSLTETITSHIARGPMNVAFINPFIESTLRSLEMMASIAAEKVGLSVKEDLITTYDISAIIGITGDTSGSIILSFPVGVACRIASNMLMEEISSLDKSVEDAIGEIGNIVVGDARRLLIQDGYSLSISVPTVVVGKGHKISRSGDVPCIAIPFRTAFGEFEVNVGLKE